MPKANQLWNRRLILLIAALSLVNGLWMIFDAMGWYHDLPAAVPDFGPLNEHFVRDLGGAFIAFSVAMIWAAFDAQNRFALLVVTALFYLFHAGGHIYDTLRDFVDASHWWIDFPGVYLPAALLLYLLLSEFSQRANLMKES